MVKDDFQWRNSTERYCLFNINRGRQYYSSIYTHFLDIVIENYYRCNHHLWSKGHDIKFSKILKIERFKVFMYNQKYFLKICFKKSGFYFSGSFSLQLVVCSKTDTHLYENHHICFWISVIRSSEVP